MTELPRQELTFDDSDWFRRYRYAPGDLEEVRAEVAVRRAELATTQSARDELATRIDLGAGLFPLGQEAESVAVLEPALALAERLDDQAALSAVRLHLATALQYVGRADEALPMFDAALAAVRATGADAEEHYLLHHQGRCLAEAGDVEAARASFERALELRLAGGEPWMIESTRTALGELDAWCAARRAAGPSASPSA
jgi:tetratricopeptide (TPR) repeat protein